MCSHETLRTMAWGGRECVKCRGIVECCQEPRLTNAIAKKKNRQSFFSKAQLWELVLNGGELLHLDRATCLDIFYRVWRWRTLPNENAYALLAFATYDTVVDLGIGEDEKRIAQVYDVPVKTLLRIERKLVRVRAQTPLSFLPLLTKRWNLSFVQHTGIRRVLSDHETVLLSVRHTPKSVAAAAAFIYLQTSSEELQKSDEGKSDNFFFDLNVCAQTIGLHRVTLKRTVDEIVNLLHLEGKYFLMCGYLPQFISNYFFVCL